MDEVFWSNVVKRWSDASENVIKLRKELAELQKERALYISLIDHPRSTEDRGSQHSEHIKDDSAHFPPASTIRDELQDAEAGLGRAKEEYRRLQDELALSSERIKALSLENENIHLRHQEEIEKLHETIRSMTIAQKDRQDSHAGKEMNNISPAPTDIVGIERDGRKHSLHYTPNDALIAALHKEVEGLKFSVDMREADNQDLRHKLAVAQETLRKAEERQKALVGSIVKLQNITRTSVLGTLDPNLRHSDASRKSLKRISLSSNNSSFQNLEAKDVPRIKRATQTEATFHSRPSQVDDKTVIEHHPISLTLEKFPERDKVIADLPVVGYPGINQSENTFERDFLKCALGEGVQSLLEHMPDDRAVDKKTLTTSYLCPTLNHHPWCPSTPGQHGFIFVGLGKEKDAYNTPVIRNLFVGLSKSQPNNRRFRYLGKYRVNRINSLTVEEWNALSLDIKTMYTKLTKEKDKDNRSLEDIMTAYDQGKLSVPCVQLQCISFDSQLYSALISWARKP